MVNVLQAIIFTDNEKMVLTPTFYVFEMYKVHQDAALIPLSFNHLFTHLMVKTFGL